MKKPVMLIIVATLAATPVFVEFNSRVDVPSSQVKKGSFLSSGLLLAQAQAPGRPVTADEARQTAPQTPVTDRIAPTVPPSPPRNTPEPRRGSVGAVRD
jgi:hypothetical protein